MTVQKISLLSLPVLVVALAATAGEPLRGLSKPSSDVTLSFVRPGKIASIPVKDGDAVKAGQVLAEQDDLAERFNLEQLKAQAEDVIRIDAAQAQLDQKKVDLKKLQKAAEFNAATVLEVEHAVLDVKIADLSLALARFEREQARLKFKEMEQQVARMRILCPIDGKVEKLSKKQGESVDALDPVVRVVNTDVLWVEVPTDPRTVSTLACGQEAELDFPTDSAADPKKTCTGKIIFIPSVKDGASNTCLVRVEAGNVFNRRAGEHVMVTFLPQAQASAAARPAATPQPAAAAAIGHNK